MTTDETATADGEPSHLPDARRRLRALSRPLAGNAMPLLERDEGSDAEQLERRQAASEALQFSREQSDLNLPAAPAARRVARMLRLLRKKYSSNDTHALVELTALVPVAPLRFPTLRDKSPLVGDEEGEFWEYVSNPIVKDEGLAGTAARLESDKVARTSLSGVNADLADKIFDEHGVGFTSLKDGYHSAMQKKYVEGFRYSRS